MKYLLLFLLLSTPALAQVVDPNNDGCVTETEVLDQALAVNPGWEPQRTDLLTGSVLHYYLQNFTIPWEVDLAVSYDDPNNLNLLQLLFFKECYLAGAWLDKLLVRLAIIEATKKAQADGY